MKRKQDTDISRYERSIKRVRSGLSQTFVSSSPTLDQLQNVVIESPKTADASVQATVKTTEKEMCTSPEVKQTTQIVELNRTYPFTKDELEDDNTKVRYYSGLPSFTVLMTIYNFIAPYISNHGGNSLPKFQQFMMVLMKLRLNLANQDLAYRFNIHQSTVSRKFRLWIDAMFVRLRPLIKWPERDVVRDTMPMTFRNNFKKCICIIDCFEIFCERPTGLKARAQTYSQYKHHNTVKFLIAITPQGSISFISKGWGGRVSDLHITENCGLLQNLLPGDLVLADRGFNIQESVSFYCAEVKIPAFTRGKPQLSQMELDTTRELAHVRIHVERVIGLLKQKYAFLRGELPINVIKCDSSSEYSMIDKIVTVCCALCNVCEPIIPYE